MWRLLPYEALLYSGIISEEVDDLICICCMVAAQLLLEVNGLQISGYENGRMHSNVNVSTTLTIKFMAKA